MSLTKDFLTGVMFLAVGGLAVIVGSSYPLGTPMQMGPGFFPVAIGSVCALLGVAIGGRALLHPDTSERPAGIAWRPLVLLPAAIVLFGLLIRFGLIPAVVALTVVARLAGPKARPLELLILTATLTAIAVLVFIVGLRMPIALWR